MAPIRKTNTESGDEVEGGDGGDNGDGGYGGYSVDGVDGVNGGDDGDDGDGGYGGDDVDDKNVHFIPSSSLHCTVLAQYSAEYLNILPAAPNLALALTNYMQFSHRIE